jgi:hypothetical protein
VVTGNKAQACDECMPDIIVEEVEIKGPEQNPCKVTEGTVQWARIRDLMNEVDAKLFQASTIARLEMKNDDLHRELYKHRVDMRFTNMRIRNALKHDRHPSPFYKTVSQLEAELAKEGNNEGKEET